jgi:hypothetical protein
MATGRIELQERQREVIVRKEELSKDERSRLLHEDNFDCQDGGNKLEDVI